MGCVAAQWKTFFGFQLKFTIGSLLIIKSGNSKSTAKLVLLQDPKLYSDTIFLSMYLCKMLELEEVSIRKQSASLIYNSQIARAKSKNVWFCCTLLEKKVEEFCKVVLMVNNVLKMSVLALSLWSIRVKRPKTKGAD